MRQIFARGSNARVTRRRADSCASKYDQTREAAGYDGKMAMTAPNQEQALRQVISELGHVPSDFAAAADFYDDLGLDSFRMVEIFLAVEKRFDAKIAEDDYLTLRSLTQFMAFLQK
jgi:acyl carrier protein